MSGRGTGDDEGERLRRVTERAIRRLDVLEFVILGAAVVLALAAGGLVAYLVAAATELPLRTVWVVASLLFFVVPAALARWSNRETDGSGADAPTDRHSNDQ